MKENKKQDEARTADAIQWMHFMAAQGGQALDELEQTLDGKLGVLGKRLRDALADLFSTEDKDEILSRELLIFDANQEDAWLNPELFYFVPANRVTQEIRYPAREVWKALVGAVIMADPDDAEKWFGLTPGKRGFQSLVASPAVSQEPIDTLYRVLELLVRGMPEHEGAVETGELKDLLESSQSGDQQASRQLEAMAFKTGNAPLWRYAMAMVDGKEYIARMYEDRICLE